MAVWVGQNGGMVCNCIAYPFPHRRNGGKCSVLSRFFTASSHASAVVAPLSTWLPGLEAIRQRDQAICDAIAKAMAIPTSVIENSERLAEINEYVHLFHSPVARMKGKSHAPPQS